MHSKKTAIPDLKIQILQGFVAIFVYIIINTMQFI